MDAAAEENVCEHFSKCFQRLADANLPIYYNITTHCIDVPVFYIF